MAATETLSSLRTKVRDHIDEDTADYWTDAELNRYISRRQLDLWRRIYAIKKDYWLASFTLSIVSGKYSYAPADGVPTDIFRIIAMRTTTSGFETIEWHWSDPNSMVFLDGLNASNPVSYANMYLYALRNMTTIEVSPLPQNTLSVLTTYIQQPTVVSADTDTFLIPDAFIDYIEYMATVDALAKGPVGDSSFWKAQAQESWMRIVEALDTPRSNQNADVVRGAFSDWT